MELTLKTRVVDIIFLLLPPPPHGLLLGAAK